MPVVCYVVFTLVWCIVKDRLGIVALGIVALGIPYLY